MLITFEGIDGSGKSTHIQAVAQFLQTQNVQVLLSREPGGTHIGEQIREILLANKNTKMNPQAELLLFSASRAQIVHEVLRPHMESGGVVLLDRFYDSTIAYQGYGHGLDLNVLRTITNFATGGLVPDMTLYLELSPQVALNRRYHASLFGEQFDRLDGLEAEFRQRVVDGYEVIAKAEPERFVRINAEQSLESVQNDVIHRICDKLGIAHPA